MSENELINQELDPVQGEEQPNVNEEVHEELASAEAETVEEIVAEPEVASEEVQPEVVAEEPTQAETNESELTVEAEQETIPVAEPQTVAEEVQEEAPKASEPVVQDKPKYQPRNVDRELSVPPAFDWGSIGKKQDAYSNTERERLADAYDKTLSQIGEHEVIDGSVVGITNREVVVNIGYKSDGVIPLSELKYRDDLKIGDKIEVYVESQEDQGGQLQLSHKKARILRSWERVNEAFNSDEIIKGYVKCRTKGGLIVDVFGIEAFLPGSQIDVKPIRDYDMYVDKIMEFKVVKINQEYKNVVVSHKALIEDELEQQKAEIIARLEKGQILEGTVKNITTYGVFVDLGGVDGLIHITDLSWGRINHPEEIVQLDQKIKVVILDFDDNKKRIALGLKQLTPHPWDSLDKEIKVGDKVKGKVVVIADYGAFVEITAGVEGLIHVSEMSWSQHLRTAHDFLKVGDEVDAVILTLDREERKMSLGMKQLIPDPWADIVKKYPINSKHTATVRNFTNFGIFVELEEGVDGLIHISDLSWAKKIKHPAEFTKIGESIEVLVLDVDVENRRLSLGHKQLEENPWDVFESIFMEGTVHKGTVMNINDKGAVIALPYGVEGFAPKRHMQKEEGGMLKVDEACDFKVIEFSKENKKIILSHSRIHQDAQAAEKNKEQTQARTAERSTKKAVKKIKDNLERTTLGDLEALANLKEEMEQKEESAQKEIKAEKAASARKAAEALSQASEEEADTPDAEPDAEEEQA